jgi:hypothetical protein
LQLHDCLTADAREQLVDRAKEHISDLEDEIARFVTNPFPIGEELPPMSVTEARVLSRYAKYIDPVIVGTAKHRLNEELGTKRAVLFDCGVN